MTESKKLRIIREYIEKGCGEQVILIIRDRWKFDPDVTPYKYPIREQYTVNDALKQYEEKKGYIYEGISFKDLCKYIERKQKVDIDKTYKDSYDLFHETYPEYEEQMRKKFNAFMNAAGGNYKDMFV